MYQSQQSSSMDTLSHHRTHVPKVLGARFMSNLEFRYQIIVHVSTIKLRRNDGSDIKL